MITYLFGISGSGKTSQAIKVALNHINKNREVFSNIKPATAIDGYNYINFQSMQNFIKLIFSILEEKDREMEYYIDKLKKITKKKALYIIDEANCYGFTDRKKFDCWRFFLSIHRHLDIDILITTKNHENVNLELLELGDVFLNAIHPNFKQDLRIF